MVPTKVPTEQRPWPTSRLSGPWPSTSDMRGRRRTIPGMRARRRLVRLPLVQAAAHLTLEKVPSAMWHFSHLKTRRYLRESRNHMAGVVSETLRRLIEGKSTISAHCFVPFVFLESLSPPPTYAFVLIQAWSQPHYVGVFVLVFVFVLGRRSHFIVTRINGSCCSDQTSPEAGEIEIVLGNGPCKLYNPKFKIHRHLHCHWGLQVMAFPVVPSSKRANKVFVDDEFQVDIDVQDQDQTLAQALWLLVKCQVSINQSTLLGGPSPRFSACDSQSIW